MSVQKKNWIVLISLGGLSAILYYFLYLYSNDLLEIAQRVQKGEKLLFLVPIAIAFVFSYIHGSFTGKFWTVLGLVAKK